MTWLLSSISDQVAFSLRPLTTTVASVRRNVLLPAFAFFTVSSVAVIAVTVPPNRSFAAGRCVFAGLAVVVAAGAAMAPVASTPASTPAVAIPAKTLPIILFTPPVLSERISTGPSVAPAAEASAGEALDVAERARQ